MNTKPTIKMLNRNVRGLGPVETIPGTLRRSQDPWNQDKGVIYVCDLQTGEVYLADVCDLRNPTRDHSDGFQAFFPIRLATA